MSRITEQLAEYESRVRLNPLDLRARWQILVCRYGILELPGSDPEQPQLFLGRMGQKPIYEDRDAAFLMQQAEGSEKQEYLRRINLIASMQDEVQKVAQTTAPFDVYLVTGAANEENTSICEEIYAHLALDGVRTFYEPYVKTVHDPDAYRLYALSTAKLLVPVATNEHTFPDMEPAWKRFLPLMEEDSDLHILPVYKGVSPKSFPEEIARLEGIDVGVIGAVSAYVLPRVRELTGKNQVIMVRRKDGRTANLTNIFNRIEFMVENKDFEEADTRIAKAIDEFGDDYPKLRELRLLSSCRVSNFKELAMMAGDEVEKNPDYKYLLEKGGEEIRSILLSLGNWKAQQIREKEEQDLIDKIKEAHRKEDYRGVLALVQQIREMPDFTRYGEVEGFYSIAEARVEQQKILEAYHYEMSDPKTFYKKRLAQKYPEKYRELKEYIDSDGNKAAREKNKSDIITALIFLLAFPIAVLICRCAPVIIVLIAVPAIFGMISNWLYEKKEKERGLFGSLFFTFLKMILLPGIILFAAEAVMELKFDLKLLNIILGEANLSSRNDSLFILLELVITIGMTIQGIPKLTKALKAHKASQQHEDEHTALLQWLQEFQAAEYKQLADKYKDKVGVDWRDPIPMYFGDGGTILRK